MSFETDKQTLDDLNILGKYKNNSVYSLFKDVKTRGGERLLEQMFTNPLCDAKEINERADIFKRFQGEVPAFPVDCNLFDSVEQYLSGISDKSALVLLMNLWKMKSLEIIGNNPHLSLLREQVAATLSFLKVARIYLDALSKVVKDCPLEERVTQGVQLLQRKELEDLVNINEAQSMNDLFRCEKVLRNTLNAPLNALLKLFYELDVATMVGQVARERNFCFATANVEQEVSIGIKGLFHPCLTKAIANDIEITKKKTFSF